MNELTPPEIREALEIMSDRFDDAVLCHQYFVSVYCPECDFEHLIPVEVFDN